MTICWFLRSLPDNRIGKVRAVPDGGFSLILPGTANVSPYVNVTGTRRDILLPSRLPNEIPDLIFNEISSPETHERGLAICQNLMDKIGCPIINSPEGVSRTRRHLVAETLQNIQGLRVPRVVGCQPKSPAHVLKLAADAGIQMPFLIRETGSHGGQGLLCIASSQDRSSLHRCAFDGREFYITEFIDTRGSDGQYRKVRIVVVDGQPFVRHLLISESWNVHASAARQMERDESHLAEERVAVASLSPEHRQVATTIYRRLGLDYFGIDLGINRDGTLTLFEANANLNVLINTRSDVAGQNRVIAPIVQAIETMIQNRIDPRPTDVVDLAKDPSTRGSLTRSTTIVSPSLQYAQLREQSLSLRQAGHYQRAAESYRILGQVQPNPLTDLAIASVCPAVFSDSAEMDRYAAELTATLDDYSSRDFSITPVDLVTTDAAPAFNLIFFNDPLLKWKSAYGRCFDRAIDAPHCPPSKRKKPRIGIVIPPKHENVFLRMRGGIFSRLASDRWDLTFICLDECSELLRRAYQGIDGIELATIDRRFDASIKTVGELSCDVLYYSTVCDDLLSYFLPFYRLAPIQVTTIGTQSTSGIPAIDYYLSSEFVEPHDAAEHYTEKLILASTLVSYVPRIHRPEKAKTNQDFGIPSGRNLYVNAQPHLGKLHPDFDAVLAEILQSDPLAHVVSVSHMIQPEREAIKRRWRNKLPEFADRITLLPYLSKPDYYSLLSIADVILDAPYFSGVNTTIDAFSLGKVIVTRTGKHHRGRFTTGCYDKMGIAGFAVNDLPDYASLAVSVATDRATRSRAEDEIREASECLFDDHHVVEEYRQMFERLIDEARSI